MKSQEILNDKRSNGKVNDWRGKKLSSMKIADIYAKIGECAEVKEDYKKRGVYEKFKKIEQKIKDFDGNLTGVSVSDVSMGLFDRDGKRVINYEKKAKNMKFCGRQLDFAKIDDKLKLIKANFCRVALCPMCQWRKTLRVFYDTSRIASELEERNKNLKAIFLTLTVKNCSVENLNKTLDNMFNAWHDFMRSKTLNPMVRGEIKHIVKGWFRALEVSYDGGEFITQRQYNKAREYYNKQGVKVGDKNPNFNMFHPHFHAILYVDESYFKGADYLHTEDWVKLWQKSARLDYAPVCDVRLVKKGGRKKEIAEVAKYTYKDAEILKIAMSGDKKVEVVKGMCDAFHQRKLYAYGGLMKSIAAELKIKDADKSDLVTVDGDKLNGNIAAAILRYRWNVGLSNYVLDCDDVE